MRRASGLSRKAIAKGIREIETGEAPEEGRIRRPGAGRKFLSVSDPRLVDALEQMIEGATRGDPSLRCAWTSKNGDRHAAWHGDGPALGRLAHVSVQLRLTYKAITKPQEGRGSRPSGPGRTVPAHRRRREKGPGPRVSRDLGGHQKERTPRQLRQCRRAMAADPPAASSAGARLSQSGSSPIPMAFTTWGAMPALSTWEPITTPELLPWLPFEDGGALKESGFIRGRAGF